MQTKTIVDKIAELKKTRGAVILAHNYQLPEVQDIADYGGDSLELSRIAAKLEAKVIVFCGVLFMAETASILSPGKTILLPDLHAGCPMADMINAEQLKDLKRKHPGAIVVAYVNSSAEVKAETDYCCTSANAVKVVDYLKDKGEIIFVPDKHLGQYAAKKTGKKMIIWDGFCPTHVRMSAEDVKRERKLHPEAKVIVHPECRTEVVELSDGAFSTSGMLKYVKESPANEFILGTEMGIIHRLQKENPMKKFYLVSELAVCPNMKEITLEKVLWCLEEMKHEVKVPQAIAEKAKKAVDRMLEIG